MRVVRVEGVSGLPLGEGAGGAAAAAVDEAAFVVTAVGAPNLAKVARLLADAAGRRSPERPLRVLCAENGVDIALGLRREVEQSAGRSLGAALLVGDTVMGRMCKIVSPPEAGTAAPAPGQDWAVVAEPFFGIPVEEHVFSGAELVPAAVDPQAPERFHASEDVKMLAHNGLHAVLSCIGHLKGAAHFDDLREDGELMELGRRLLVEEAGRALLGKHGGALGRNEYANYCDSILRRVTCPVLHDPIARGVRGTMRKLQPWERLVYSVRTVAEQRGEPWAFAAGLAAAATIAVASGETQLDFEAVLTDHCGFDRTADRELMDLIRAQRDALPTT